MEEKKCDKHPNNTKWTYNICNKCKSDKSNEWRKKNREHCLARDRQYSIDKKDKIAKRKAESYYANKEKFYLRARNTMLKRNYGITLDEYYYLEDLQQGRCKICGKEEKQHSHKQGRVDSLRVDHCHSTGKVRGLLCSKCNFGIGQFQDDINLLEKAIQYLIDSRG